MELCGICGVHLESMGECKVHVLVLMVVVLVLAVLAVVVVVVWRDSGREGHVRRWGREGLMMWQFVIVYKHVCKLCKHAGHAGTRKCRNTQNHKKYYFLINTTSFLTTLVSF